MAKATYAKNFRFFRAFRVRKKEEADVSDLSEMLARHVFGIEIR